MTGRMKSSCQVFEQERCLKRIALGGQVALSLTGSTTVQTTEWTYLLASSATHLYSLNLDIVIPAAESKESSICSSPLFLQI